MSIFKTQGVVLQSKKVSEKEFLYQVFFLDYGILWVKKQKKTREKPIDSGYLFQCEIITSEKNTIHTIGNIKILSLFQTENRSYKEIECFMKILFSIKQNLPAGNPHKEIFDILHHCIRNTLNASQLLLLHLKIINIFGNLPDTHKENITDKTLKFIHKYDYKKILQLGEIPIETKNDLEKLFL